MTGARVLAFAPSFDKTPIAILVRRDLTIDGIP